MARKLVDSMHVHWMGLMLFLVDFDKYFWVIKICSKGTSKNRCQSSKFCSSYMILTRSFRTYWSFFPLQSFDILLRDFNFYVQSKKIQLVNFMHLFALKSAKDICTSLQIQVLPLVVKKIYKKLFSFSTCKICQPSNKSNTKATQ